MKNGTNETAVDFLFRIYNKNGELSAEHFNHASQLEKEQIENACNYGIQYGYTTKGEKYYNETYNK